MLPYQTVREEENNAGVSRAYKVVLNQTTAFTIRTIFLNSGEAGVIMVTAVGVDTSGNGVTGSKLVRYRKTPAGVLTLGTITNVLAVQNDTGMTGATFNIAAVNNNIDITVTGPTTLKDIAWKISINPGVGVSFAELDA